jgi:hypothetical protein
MSKKELVFSLIKDDLTNVHLVGGLRRIGLNTDNHDLYLSETIFKIIGFTESDQNDNLDEEYFNRSQKAVDINILEHSKEIDNLVSEIYIWLMEEKKKRLYKKLKYEKKIK